MNRHPYTKKALVIILLIAFTLSACGAQSAAEPPSFDQEAPAEGVSGEFDAGGQADNAFSTDQSIQDTQRLVIKNANLSLIVDAPGQAMDEISRMAEEMGGFVVSADLTMNRIQNGAQVPHASIMVRVPAERLDQALQQIESLSDQPPRSKSIEAQDVTQDYTDLQSQLRNLEVAEAQLQEIMDSASRTEDVLAVYRQLVDVREEIEVIQGRIQYYEQSAALSSIRVDLTANEAVQPLSIGGWQPVGVARNAVQALINFFEFLGSTAIWLIILVLPVALVLAAVIGLPVILIRRFWRQRRQRGKTKQPGQDS